MIWYKAWLETRWQFLIGLVILACSAIAVVASRPEVARLLPLANSLDVSGEIGRKIQEAAELSRTYGGYVWSHWFAQNAAQLGTLFAVLVATGSPFSQSGGTLFTLSMPVTRHRLLWVRAAVGLGEWVVLMFVPSLLIPLLSPLVGETYGIGSALIHSGCAAIAGTVFFSLAFLLSTVFEDMWRPMLLALLIAITLALAPQVVQAAAPYSIYRVMSAEMYFRSGRLPWAALLGCAAASAAMLYRAAINIAHRDF